MKDRILFYLNAFSNNIDNDLSAELQQELGMDAQTFRDRSQEVQAAVLHDYSQFSISTIDAFFQRVIRSFTRESGLLGDYRLEVDQDTVLDEVTGNLIDELGSNKELTDWVVEFARENLENEKSWDVRYSLAEFAREIFREEFKTIEDQISRTTSQEAFFQTLKNMLWRIKTDFLANVSKPAQEALSLITSNQLTPDDFSFGKNSGLFTFFTTFATERNLASINNPGTRVRNHFTDPEKWPSRNSPNASIVLRLAREHLVRLLVTIIDFYDRSFSKALSAEIALRNLYVFGLISDISRKLREYKHDNNLMLLADAPRFLNGVIQDSDTPFVYEKVGSFYKNYLIDEFQDTSGLQWKNFQPLIVNSLDQGYQSLVVGDVKQAIYRWRGGDLNLLQQGIERELGPARMERRVLAGNYRSAREIVSFNNYFFSTAATIVSEISGATDTMNVFQDVGQQISRSEEGFVRISLLREQNGEPDIEQSPVLPWREQALLQLAATMESLQHAGVGPGDIAILVRKNEEGQRIASYLLEYKNSENAKANCRYDVVSNESLRIDGASSVNLILGALRYLLNPDDAIARAQVAYEHARIRQPDKKLTEVFTVSNHAFFESGLPSRFTREKIFLRKLGLVELVETLISIFDLGEMSGELVYLLAFQDVVLDFCNREKNDLAAFLEWWEDNRHKKSIQVAGHVDAAQILTIHKAKGLQFPYVIIPFCSWSLDHDSWQAPNLWVRSAEPPFDAAGYLPVRYGKQLDTTIFADAYRHEKAKVYLDNLNLLYVALTRASEGMIITAPATEVKGARDTVAALLAQTIVRNENLRQNYDETARSWQSGHVAAAPRHESEQDAGITLTRYQAKAWHDKLVIRQSSRGYFDQAAEAWSARTRYGVQMHAALARIGNLSQWTEAVEAIVAEGFISDNERSTFEQELQDLLSIPQVASWFGPEWTVRTEVPVLMPGGDIFRIDRLLTGNGMAIVIDFKTGTPSKSDNTQVQKYMDILRKMNHPRVEGYLLYLRDKTVVEVKSEGRQRIVRSQKDKDQLSLGF